MTKLTLKTLLAQADKLQSFATESKRKLSRTKALEQAAQLNGHANYQTALAVIEKDCVSGQTKAEAAMIPTTGTMSPWQPDCGYGDGVFTIKQDSDFISIKLAKQGSANQTLEVVLEMDVDQPRLIVYRPEVYDSPIFSVHSTQSGAVLQYMNDDEHFYSKFYAPADLASEIDLVAHSTKAWVVPDPN